jgi:hypothetical protein
MAIIGVLAGLLLPAINGAREAMRRNSCLQNMTQLAKAVANYESAYRFLPPAGKGIDKAALQNYLSPSGTATYADIVKTGRYIPFSGGMPDYSPSIFLTLLPYLDNSPIYDQYNFSFEYNDKRASLGPGATDFDPNFRFGNIGTSSVQLSFLRCSSNPVPANDPFKFGRTDYAATVYTDIYPGPQYMPVTNPPATGAKYLRSIEEGALGLKKSVSSSIVDGASNTMLFVEDAGRADSMMGYGTMAEAIRVNPTCAIVVAGQPVAYACAPAIGEAGLNHYTVHRWADPNAAAIGISGGSDTELTVAKEFVNNSSTKLGGSPGSEWSKHNFGNNQEAYAFHRGGVNVVMSDASGHFLSETIDPVTLRFLITKGEKKQPPQPPFE